MKLRFLLLALAIAVSAQAASAQNSIKLFDAMPVSVGTGPEVRVYATKQVFLTCEIKGKNSSYLTGPDGGPLIATGGIFLNGEPVMRSKGKQSTVSMFSSVLADPLIFLGNPVENAYASVDPVSVSSLLSKNGLYTFELAEWSSTYGNTDIYLNTTCGINVQ